jgi:hypothetical protein
VHDNFKDPSLWEGLTTRTGMSADLVVAALQKEIRRGGAGPGSSHALPPLAKTCRRQGWAKRAAHVCPGVQA